jgi:hypothetical protein
LRCVSTSLRMKHDIDGVSPEALDSLKYGEKSNK